MYNANLQLFSTNKQTNKQLTNCQTSTNYQTKLSKIFTTVLALILSLTLSLTPNSVFASALANTNSTSSTSSTNTSFFNNTTAVVATAAVGALGLGAILVGLLSNNSNNNNNNSNNDSPTAELTSITITPHAPSIASSTTQQFHAIGTYNDGTTQDLTKSVTWHSSHASIATISNASGSHGLATAADNDTSGSITTTITAKLSGITSHGITLTVTPAVLTSITITPHAPSIASSTTQQFHATGHYNDGTTQDLTKSVTWNSSHTSVATISNASGSHGLATALSNDTSESVTTKITAALSGITSHGITLTITPAPSPIPTTFTVTPSGDSNETINPSSPQSVASGNTQVFAVTPKSGYAVSSTVTGTCPAGSWSGSNYTTGAITGDCSLGFSATQVYTITYHLNGGSGGSVSDGYTVSYPAGSAAIALSYSGLNVSGISMKTSAPDGSSYPCVQWNTAADGSGTSYLSGAPLPQTNTPLYAQYFTTSMLGAQMGGGTLIAINNAPAAGFRQLLIMASGSDQSSGMMWATLSGGGVDAVKTSAYHGSIAGDAGCGVINGNSDVCTYDKIGSGLVNEQLILASLVSGDTSSIVSVCQGNINGFSDWYPPSKWELNEAFVSGVLSGAVYWSSTESAGVSALAWFQFGIGVQYQFVKSVDSVRVRAVRAINY